MCSGEENDVCGSGEEECRVHRNQKWVWCKMNIHIGLFQLMTIQGREME